MPCLTIDTRLRTIDKAIFDGAIVPVASHSKKFRAGYDADEYHRMRRCHFSPVIGRHTDAFVERVSERMGDMLNPEQQRPTDEKAKRRRRCGQRLVVAELFARRCDTIERHAPFRLFHYMIDLNKSFHGRVRDFYGRLLRWKDDHGSLFDRKRFRCVPIARNTGAVFSDTDRVGNSIICDTVTRYATRIGLDCKHVLRQFIGSDGQVYAEEDSDNGDDYRSQCAHLSLREKLALLCGSVELAVRKSDASRKMVAEFIGTNAGC